MSLKNNFDWKFYLERNPDLNRFWATPFLANLHWKLFGMQEGRIKSDKISWEVPGYMVGEGRKKSHEKIAILSILKSEDPFVREWIAYHLLLGFDKIILYDNDKRLPLKSLTRQFGDRVKVIHWINFPDKYFEKESPQMTAYADAFKNHLADIDWVAVIDADEFIVLPGSQNIKEFLWNCRKIDSIGLNWHNFSNNGYYERPDNFLVLESLSKRQKNPDLVIKSISRVKSIEEIYCNYAILKQGTKKVSAELRIVESPSIPDHDRYARIYVNPNKYLPHINHYPARSFVDWMEKSKRGSALNSEAYNELHAWRFTKEGYLKQYVSVVSLNFNEIIDIEMLKFVSPVKKLLNEKRA